MNMPESGNYEPPVSPEQTSGELSRLRHENEELRKLLANMGEILQSIETFKEENQELIEKYRSGSRSTNTQKDIRNLLSKYSKI